MKLTISYGTEGEHTETVHNLDHGLDRAEKLAEAGNMQSRYTEATGVITIYRDRIPTFYGYIQE